MLPFLLDHILTAALQVWQTFTHNWPFLVVSVIIAALLKIYMKPEVISGFLNRHKKAGVLAATGVAVTTPLCSCGTMAMILGMMANMMPWAPIIAFMVASPLTSPEEFIYSAGLFGWPFATAFFVASIVLGLAGGVVAAFAESRGWLEGQARIQTAPKKVLPNKAPTITLGHLEPQPALVPAQSLVLLSESSSGSFTLPAAQLRAPASINSTAPCSCSGSAPTTVSTKSAAPCSCSGLAPTTVSTPACGCSDQAEQKSDDKIKAIALESIKMGKTLLVMFAVFAFIGYFLNGLIPPEWVAAVFGSGKPYGVPLAATLGLPLYINTEGSLPLVRAMLDSGMSAGAALAFLICGAGTSIGAMAGALTIARWRVIAIVIGTLWAGSILIGYAYNMLMG